MIMDNNNNFKLLILLIIKKDIYLMDFKFKEIISLNCFNKIIIKPCLYIKLKVSGVNIKVRYQDYNKHMYKQLPKM